MITYIIEFLHALSKSKKDISCHYTSLLCIIHVRGHKQQASAGDNIFQRAKRERCGAFTEKGTSPALRSPLARSLCDAASRFLCTLSAHNFTPVLYAAPHCSRADKGPEKCVSLYKQMRVASTFQPAFIQKRTPLHILRPACQ
jgi:hypothetical protein